MEINEELIDNFCADQRIADSTKKVYAGNLNLLREYLEGRDFSRTNINKYIDELKNPPDDESAAQEKRKPLNDKTISHRLTVIRCFAKWLWEEDYIDIKFYKKIRGMKYKVDEGEDNRRALTPEEEEKLKLVAEPIRRMLLWTGINYGLRLQEYRNLILEDVDTKNRLLTIKGKGNKTRTIKILRKQVAIWRQWFKQREAYDLNHNYVFFTSKGKAGERSIRRHFEWVSEFNMKKSYKEQTRKERITSHTLRYTFAVKCWRGGMDLFVLSKMLGHTSLITTQTYLCVKDEEILDKFEVQANSIF